MSLQVIWTPAAEEALRRLADWRAAARVARAVHDLATTGQGNVRRVGTSRTEFSLYVLPYCVRLSIEREARILRVWTVFTLR